MRIPVDTATATLEVRKSRFIATAYPIESITAVRQLVQEEKQAHPDANHVVHAAVFGPNGDSFSCSDDHEPKNTAGRPALEVLKGSGLTNIAVLIVRYFGGTLLGTGGLVKAYGESTRLVLDKVATKPLVATDHFTITTAYERYRLVVDYLKELSCTIEDEQFATDITIVGTVYSLRKDELKQQIADLSNGKDCIAFT